MLETYFSASKMLGHLRSGPSGPYLDRFAAALQQQGYGPATAVRYLRAAAHIGHVMVEQGASLTDIDLATFGEHLRRCRCPRAKGGRRNHHTIYGARLFRRHLVEIGACRPAATSATPAEPKLVTDFKVWLQKHRGCVVCREIPCVSSVFCCETAIPVSVLWNEKKSTHFYDAKTLLLQQNGADRI